MKRRQVESLVRSRLEAYPAVALVGPRQCGKTTLAKAIGGLYFDLEQEQERLRLDVEWNRIVEPARRASAAGGSAGQLIILDEAQGAPEVFPRLRGAIDDARRCNGRFLILGSVSPGLMRQVSDSLAGRLALVELTPFLLGEAPEVSLETVWLVGGFPDGGILDPPDATRFPRWQDDYLKLLVARDLPHWGLPAKPQLTERLLRMVAAVHGQTWNASQIGKSLGLSYATVNSYLNYLEGAFLIRRLPPYAANLKKRIVKSPKCYVRDTGLLHALLGFESSRKLLVQPWVGASWEGFVIEQILGALGVLDVRHAPFFLRTSDRYELDLLLEIVGELWAFEIKLTSEPSRQDFDRLEKTAELVSADWKVLVSQTREPLRDGKRLSVTLPWLLEFLAEHVG
jgi:hypothetical protein